MSAYFGTTAKFWLGLQDDYDLEAERALIPEVIKAIRLTRTSKLTAQTKGA